MWLHIFVPRWAVLGPVLLFSFQMAVLIVRVVLDHGLIIFSLVIPRAELVFSVNRDGCNPGVVAESSPATNPLIRHCFFLAVGL